MTGAFGIRCEGRFLVGQDNRVRLLRGVNVSGRSKLPPFAPFDDGLHFDQLQAWGFNAIRFLLIWEGVQPQRDRIDHTYLDRMANLAEQAGRRGLHVIVDLHQDLFARAYGGDGAPAWVTGEKRLPPAGKTWFLRYLHPTVWRAQDAFWKHENGWQAAFLEALEAVMARFAGVDAVVGYDAWNEPMAGPVAFASGRFEQEWLPAFYGRCAEIRDRADKERLLFVEPSAMSGLGAPVRLPRLAIDGLVYAPHAYDTAAIGMGRYRRRLASFPGILRTHDRVAQHQNAPMLIGEFGALNGMHNPASMLSDECRALDRSFTSWTAWHYNPTEVDWNDEGASIVGPGGTEKPFTRTLIRPYPERLAGRPIAWESDPSRPWLFSYVADATGSTEFVVPERWAPEGYAIEVTGGTATRVPRGIVVVAPEGTTVRVRLDRQSPTPRTVG